MIAAESNKCAADNAVEYQMKEVKNQCSSNLLLMIRFGREMGRVESIRYRFVESNGMYLIRSQETK